MSYDPTVWTTGQKVTATKMNKLEQGVANAGGYDLVIASNTPVNTGVQTISNWEITQGSIAAIEAKIENGLPINAMAIAWDFQWSQAAPNDGRFYMPLCYFHAPYQLLYFGGILNFYGGVTSTAISYSPNYAYVTFKYDYETKLLTHAHYGITPLVVDS